MLYETCRKTMTNVGINFNYSVVIARSAHSRSPKSAEYRAPNPIQTQRIL
jgi:hypothetical protein